ncbi:MAG: DMT family transporter [Bacillota bacterium]|nr:DMT family transporter [Bacillota bacterium]HOP70472.1 DMT family transporter [Bacillota bacterium]HPT34986.1 DMT family transporter [Bacillota bacterium]HPZ84978.1 DMT family transporter [Bacillota bacterium]HQD85602.1 DMT family transporter [Bacillota bacterium]
MNIWPLIIAGLAGGSMAVQGVLNSILGEKIGEIEATFVVHVIATALLGLVLVSGLSGGNLRNIGTAPWFGFLGGPLSVIIVWGVLTSIAKVGAASATTAILTVQILTALALDYFGVTGQKADIGITKAVGVVVFIVGAYLLLREA